MKKTILTICAMLPLATMALVTGDAVKDFTPKSLNDKKVSLSGNSYRASDPYNHLRVITIYATFFPNVAEHLVMLDELTTKYQDKDLQVLALSPEPELQLNQFIKQLPTLQNIAITADSMGTHTNYLLDGSMLSARSFILNSDKMIIWDGATDDVPEALEAMYGDKFSGTNQRQISNWQTQLEVAFASANSPEALRLSQKILNVAPTNTMALRGYMVASDSASNPVEAYEFLSSLQAKNPNSAKLYFIMLEQCAKTPQYASNAGYYATEFAKKFPLKSSDINQICWGLLNNFTLQAEALKAVGALCKQLESATATPQILTTMALYQSRIGQLNKAVELQQKAIDLSTNSDEKMILQSFLNYYQTAIAEVKK